MAKKVYELKHPHGGFDGFETGLCLNRDDQVEIDTETAGKATLTAIANGRLVVAEEIRKKETGKPATGKPATGKSE